MQSRRAQWTTVAVIFAALAAVAGTWLALDSRPPVWDYANHLERMIRCAADLAAGDVDRLLDRSNLYPPLVLCAAGLGYLAVPWDVGVAQTVVLAFLALGMAAVYWLGRHFADGPAGVVAALVFGSAPFIVYLSVRFQLDLPLAAMVATTLALLVRTESFARRGWSAAAGVAFGLGMLTKPAYVVYVLPALAVVAAGARTRIAAGHAALAAVLAASLSLPWYGRRLFGIGSQIAVQAGRRGLQEGDPDPFSLAGLSWYPEQFATQFGWLAAMLFCVGLALALRRRQWFLVASAILPFALCLMARNKDLRYTLPLLPVAAVLAGSGFSAASPRVRQVLACALVLASALQVSATAFGVPAGWRLPILGAPLGFESPPAAEDWRQREILSIIERDAAGAPRTISVVPNHPFFAVSNFRYYALRDGLPMRFIRAWEDEPLGVDYMILKSGAIGPDWTIRKPQQVMARLAGDPHLARVFPVLAELPLPDGSTATVRGRRITHALDAPAGRVAQAIEMALPRRLGQFVRDADQLSVRLSYDDNIRRGRIGQVAVSALAATLGEFARRDAATLRVRDLRVVFDDVLVNPYSAWLDGRLEPLAIGRVRVERATVSQEALVSFLRGLRGQRGVTARLEEGAVALHWALPGPDVSARVRVLAGPDGHMTLIADAVRVAGLPVPDILTGWIMRQFDPGPRLRDRLSIETTVAPLTITPQAVHVGAP